MNALRPITGRMVLIWALSFFGIILAANALLVFFALDTWPGLSTDKAYEEGLAYNRTLEAANRQANMGWTSAVVFDGALQSGAVRVRLNGPDGSPVSGVTVRVTLRRPVVEGFDVSASLNEAAPGVYAAPVQLPKPGRWHAAVEARRGQDIVYRMRHELMVSP